MNHHCDIQIQACTTEDTRGLWGPNINRLQWGNFNKQIFLFNFFMEMQMEMAQIINVMTGALQMATQIPKIHIIAYIPVLPKVAYIWCSTS
jgi:hypothetical protein